MSSSRGIRSPAGRASQPALMHSAADAPANDSHYRGEADVFVLAGILSERIIRNHAFPDGNKRAAFLAADLFLGMNGDQLRGGDEVNEGLRDALVEVAAGRWTAGELGECYRSLSRAVD